MKKPEEEKKYLRVTEVASLLEVSESRAYKIMRQLNKELEKQNEVKGDLQGEGTALSLPKRRHYPDLQQMRDDTANGNAKHRRPEHGNRRPRQGIL